MIKRFLAFILSVCLISSFFCFPAFAYENPVQCSLQMPGFGTVPIVDGCVGQKSFTAGNSSTQQSLSNLYVVNPTHNTYIQFKVWILGVVYDQSIFPSCYSYYGSPGDSINNDDWVVVKRLIRVPQSRIWTYTGTGLTVDSHNYDVYGLFITVKYQGDDYNGIKSINLGSSLSVSTSTSENYLGLAYMDQVCITSDVSLVLDNILSTLDSTYDFLQDFFASDTYTYWQSFFDLTETLQGYVFDIRRKMVVASNYDYISISYDSDGNVSTGTSKSTWYQALLNTLNSLTMPFKVQVEQEQKAKDSGANDALDLAYDSVGSSFGSLGDLSGLGSLGSFNGDALGSAGTGGLLSWFSIDNANSIDAVPSNRSPDNILDFYSGKIESYREEVSAEDGTADN